MFLTFWDKFQFLKTKRCLFLCTTPVFPSFFGVDMFSSKWDPHTPYYLKPWKTSNSWQTTAPFHTPGLGSRVLGSADGAKWPLRRYSVWGNILNYSAHISNIFPACCCLACSSMMLCLIWLLKTLHYRRHPPHPHPPRHHHLHLCSRKSAWPDLSDPGPKKAPAVWAAIIYVPYR